MKKTLLLLLVSISTFGAYCQKFCDGYIFSYPADTMKVQIKNKGIKEEEIDNYKLGVRYKDSSGKNQILWPSDCLGFIFFTDKGDTVDYRSARMNGSDVFAKRIQKGKISLLYYLMPEKSDMSLGPNGRIYGYYTKEYKAYFLSLDDYNYTQIGGTKFKKEDKEKLKTFFSGSPEFLQKL